MSSEKANVQLIKNETVFSFGLGSVFVSPNRMCIFLNHAEIEGCCFRLLYSYCFLYCLLRFAAHHRVTCDGLEFAQMFKNNRTALPCIMATAIRASSAAWVFLHVYSWIMPKLCLCHCKMSYMPHDIIYFTVSKMNLSCVFDFYP